MSNFRFRVRLNRSRGINILFNVPVLCHLFCENAEQRLATARLRLEYVEPWLEPLWHPQMVGFVIYCVDLRVEFSKGDEDANITLFLDVRH